MKLLIITASLLFACASNPAHATGRNDKNINTGNYGISEVGQVRRVVSGKVVAVRSVTVKREKAGLGTLAGGAIGAAAGSQFGKGNGKNYAIAGGAILGLFTGNKLESKASQQRASEVIVEVGPNNFISVTQGVDFEIETGDKVFIIYDYQNRTRIVRG